MTDRSNSLRSEKPRRTPKKSLLDVVGPYRGPGWTSNNDTPSTSTSQCNVSGQFSENSPLPVTRSKYTPKYPSPWEDIQSLTFSSSSSSSSFSFSSSPTAAKTLPLRHSSKRCDISGDFRRTSAEDVTARLSATSLSSKPSPPLPSPPQQQQRQQQQQQQAEPGVLLRFVIRKSELKHIYVSNAQFLAQIAMVMESTRTRVHLFGWACGGGFIRDAEIGIGGEEHDRIEAMKVLLQLISKRSWPCSPDGLVLVNTGGARMSPPATSPGSLDCCLPTSAEKRDYTVLEFTRLGLAEESCKAVTTSIRNLGVMGESSFHFIKTLDNDGSNSLIVTASLKGNSASIDYQKELSTLLFDQGGFEAYYPDPRMTAVEKRSWDRLVQSAIRSMEQVKPLKQEPVPELVPELAPDVEDEGSETDQTSYDESEEDDISDITDSDISFSSESEPNSPDMSELAHFSVPRSRPRSYVVVNLKCQEGTRAHNGGTPNKGSGQQQQQQQPYQSGGSRMSSGSGSGSGGYDYSDNNSGERRKRQRREESNQPGQEADGDRRFACPYYRFNPTNREHLRCKDKSFPTLARVKGHVLRSHLKPLQCQRCCEFRAGDQGQISHHLQVKNCQKKEFIPIDPEVERKGKELSRAGRRNNWAQVCMVLFDCELADVPSPYFDTTTTTTTTTENSPTLTAPLLPPSTPSAEAAIDAIFSDTAFQNLVQQRLTVMLGEVLPKLMAAEMPNLISSYRDSQRPPSTSSGGHSAYGTLSPPIFPHRDSGIVDNSAGSMPMFNFQGSGGGGGGGGGGGNMMRLGESPYSSFGLAASTSSFESIGAGADTGPADADPYGRGGPLVFSHHSGVYDTPESGMMEIGSEAEQLNDLNQPAQFPFTSAFDGSSGGGFF